MPGLKLRELQEWMRWVITDPRGVEAALLRPHPPELGTRYQAPAQDVREFVKSSSEPERGARLGIYAEAYFQRLLTSIEDDFPATARFLGADDFARLINDYLKHSPSRSFTLADAGRDLARFAEALQPEAPWLHELIRIEWRLIESFYSPPTVAISSERLAELPGDADWAGARIRFVSGIFIEETNWPVFKFHSGLLTNERLAKATPAQSYILVHRTPDALSELIDLSACEAACLGALIKGQTLDEALLKASQAAETMDLSETLIGAWFARWTQMGLIRQIDFPMNGAPVDV